MQLSFSIDVILGNNPNKDSKSLPKSEDIVGSPARYGENGFSACSTPKKEDLSESPRSFTIEWKPSGSKKSPSPSKRSRCKLAEGRDRSCDRLKSILRSPPNARVVPAVETSLTPRIGSELIGLHSPKDLFVSKLQSLKTLQKRLSASRFLPYSVEALQNYGIHHHPHHYPYQLPYANPAQSMHSSMIHGIFSPRYSFSHGVGKTSPDKLNAELKQAKLVEDEPNKDRSSPSQDTDSAHRCTPESVIDSSCSIEDEISPGGKSSEEDNDNSNDLKDNCENITESGKNKNGKRKRVGRRLFTGFQILELEKAFAMKPYLNRMERAYISQKVNLTECQIKTWFQNRRTKEKRRGNGSEEEENALRNSGGFSIARYSNKPMRIPGYGIQLAPTYAPPDQHLQAAIVDYLRRRSTPETLVSSS